MEDKIKRINKIKNFGSFKNFQSQRELSDFETANLFFGYNGSGKTTLTRLLHYLNITELSEEIKDELQKCEFEIITHNSKKINSFASPQHFNNRIKVFNTDFVDANLQLSKGIARGLTAILSQGNINIFNAITQLDNNIANLMYNEKKLKAKKELDDSDIKLNEMLKSIAKEIKTSLDLGDMSYNINHFEKDYSNYKSMPIKPAVITSDENYNNIAEFRRLSTDVKAVDESYIKSFENLANAINIDSFKGYCKTLTTSVKRKSSTETQTVIDWLDLGKKIHSNDYAKCKFCDRPFSEKEWLTRLSVIEGIIKKDSEYEKFENIISQQKDELEKIETIFNKFKSDIRAEDFFIKTNAEQFQKQYELFDSLKTKILLYTRELINFFKSKENNIDGEMATPSETNLLLIDELKSLVVRICEIIVYDNKGFEEKENLKVKAKKNTINYYIQQNLHLLQNMEEDIKLKTGNEADARNKLKEFTLKREEKVKEYNATRQDEAVKEINNYLANLFDKSIQFLISKNERDYEIVRFIDGKSFPAKRLSEGEKNLIAFLYFIISLKKSNTTEKLKEIVVIDDPISSLDSNNIFKVEDLLIKTISEKYGQIFFFTHNYYFFVKVRNALCVKYSFKKEKSNKPLLEIYEVTKDATDFSSSLANNVLFEKHVSEYISIIAKLIDTYQSSNTTDISTGNLIRRAFEVFLSFKCPDKTSFYTKFEKLTVNKERYKYLNDLANSMSHTQETASITASSEMCYLAGKVEIKNLFDFMRETDEMHTQGLKLPKDSV